VPAGVAVWSAPAADTTSTAATYLPLALAALSLVGAVTVGFISFRGSSGNTNAERAAKLDARVDALLAKAEQDAEDAEARAQAATERAADLREQVVRLRMAVIRLGGNPDRLDAEGRSLDDPALPPPAPT
jgi:hypothetical protein